MKNTEDLSEKAIRKSCPHCDTSSYAFPYPLGETKNFRIVADSHPLTTGHVLIIPKRHLSCIGEYDEDLFQEFETLYQKVSNFLREEYGSISLFEHGKIGQSVFHSHIHLLPFGGKPEDVVPEGASNLTKLENLSELKSVFKRDGKFLFFAIGRDMWIVDPSLGKPRFF